MRWWTLALVVVGCNGATVLPLAAPTARVAPSAAAHPEASSDPDDPPRDADLTRRAEGVTQAFGNFAGELTPGAAPRRLLEAPQTMHVLDVTRDGRAIAVVRASSRTENYVDLVDAATGLAQTIYPASGQAHVDAAIFSADGKRLFVATDG